MNIAVIGTGYVGLTLACLTDFNHKIILIGRTQDKIDMLNRGESLIYEPGLDEMVKRNVQNGNLHATTDYSELKNTEVIFICVGTPSNEDGSIDLSQMKSASQSIGEQLKGTNDYKVIVVKSTVVPGTTKNVVIPILEKFSGKVAGKDFGVCMNPEFLREGTGVNDFLYPDKIVIGGIDEKSKLVLLKLYDCLDQKTPRVLTDTTTAEMIKYVQNSALAARVSFINEMANICEKYGVDVYEVAKAIGLDSRIGPKFLNAGTGFGGSCFPKDVKALLAAAKAVDIKPIFLQAILDTNYRQPFRMIELAQQVVDNLNGKKIALLGLAFKPDTDDMREAPSITIINELLKRGAKIKAYDPKAMENAKEIFGDSIEYCSSKEECVKDVDLCMLVTEWKEFRDTDLSLIECPIIDGRRAIDPERVKQYGITYKGIGWSDN